MKRDEYDDIYSYDIEDNTKYEEFDENESVDEIVEKLRGIFSEVIVYIVVLRIL